jgi:hypothetical protein
MNPIAGMRIAYERLTLRYFLPLVVVIFTASGFAGLIYESIWSHYLKLFLGHAAYAQTLVLAIFMGGMAIGAWLASRWSRRLKDLLLAYAIVEAVIGIASLVFHGVFVGTTALIFERIIPGWRGLASLISSNGRWRRPLSCRSPFSSGPPSRCSPEGCCASAGDVMDTPSPCCISRIASAQRLVCWRAGSISSRRWVCRGRWSLPQS